MKQDDIDVSAALAEIDRVVGRARLGALHLGAGDRLDRPAAELRALLDEAQRGDGSARPRWESARRGLDSFMAEVHDDLAHLAVVESGQDGRPTLRTWVSWTGATVTVFTAGASSTAQIDHDLALREATLRRIRRLRLLAIVLAAAPRVATLVTTPGGALLALPAALRLIRSIREAMETTPHDDPPS